VKRKNDNDAQNKNNEKYEAYRKRLILSSWATDKMKTKKDGEIDSESELKLSGLIRHRNSEWFFIIKWEPLCGTGTNFGKKMKHHIFLQSDICADIPAKALLIL
jgi:hypothetical protein